MNELNIIVTVKQVPDTAEVRIDPETNSLIREGIPSIINPEDVNAVEVALSLKDAHGGMVTALCMGPPQAEEALEEVLAMGVDKAVLLSDRAFAGADTLVTAFTLSGAIRKLGSFDLIVCGRQAIDGDTAQVGPQVAGFLGLPQVTYADEVVWDSEKLTVRQSLEDRTRWVQVRMPALVTVLLDSNTPRYPALYNIEAACDGSRLSRMDAAALEVPSSSLGLNASPTKVRKIFEPDRSGARGIVLSGSESEMVGTLLGKLKELQVL